MRGPAANVNPPQRYGDDSGEDEEEEEDPYADTDDLDSDYCTEECHLDDVD